ncbi:type II toxin-antitoxin system HipA family toxin (plasmid) [Azospirillum argentinense]|uniref:Type II toxin-antitoxin system HipA family toxin n=1 Tax=Azospirillum argentinense TaxID=2970906 RepID=A0A4D8Q068_9PROT|nr:type II toxin-antitoxin system HipA family toxin [Azospirillum argentinense]QCO00250.1 type II toxin-antitoxin system HipA family toxin [Azospirillum argentinense]
MPRALNVLLGDLPVGRLTLSASDGSDFRLLESYKRVYPRPVLGQTFLDDPDHTWSTRARVPPWFSNLLPEGPLRELIANQAGVPATREFYLLRHLGEDLPGGVRIVPDDAEVESSDDGEEPAVYAAGEVAGSWHFSLAGVQLKFSARRTERGLTIPVTGRGGDWIVKLPDARFRHVPLTEYATMRWAENSGIAIPELDLVRIADMTGLPSSYSDFAEPLALAIRRFDRPTPDTRVHMEDFAQILSLYPEEKYKKYNYETLAKLIKVLGSEDDLPEYIRRVVFMVASGNGDMHHKNWSLLYPDGRRAAISPAYDLVSTIQYHPDDTLALNLGGSKRWEDVTEGTFQGMARKVGIDGRLMADWVDQARTAILDAWKKNRSDFGYDTQAQENIERHLARVPLLS